MTGKKIRSTMNSYVSILSKYYKGHCLLPFTALTGHVERVLAPTCISQSSMTCFIAPITAG
eukprot:752793-Amphidinium_carterae.1